MPKEQTKEVQIQQAKEFVTYMMEHYPDFNYSHKDWIIDEEDNPFYGEHRRILSLKLEPEVSINLDCDIQLDLIGELVSILIKYLVDELEYEDWMSLTINLE